MTTKDSRETSPYVTLKTNDSRPTIRQPKTDYSTRRKVGKFKQNDSLITRPKEMYPGRSLSSEKASLGTGIVNASYEASMERTNDYANPDLKKKIHYSTTSPNLIKFLQKKQSRERLLITKAYNVNLRN